MGIEEGGEVKGIVPAPEASAGPSAGKERGILFKAEMVRAILDGRKTQTRRPVNWERLHKQASLPFPTRCRLAYFKVIDGWGIDAGDDCMRAVSCPYGRPGDRLWVRETWMENYSGEWVNGHGQLLYRASWGNVPEGQRWRPSLHMPRWASRITLEITNVRVERLQDISEADAKAEGVTPFAYDPEGDCWTDGKHKTGYQYLWNEINGWEPNAWNANPWVWVIEFRRIEASAAKPAEPSDAEQGGSK